MLGDDFPSKYDAVTEGFPRGWEESSVGAVMNTVYRYPTYYNIKYVEKGTPEVRGELLTEDGEIDFSEKTPRFISQETAVKFPRTSLVAGDIVMTVRGTMGKIGLVTREFEGANITANLIRLSPNQSIVDSEFLKFAFLTQRFKAKLDAVSPQTTIKTITVDALKSIRLLLPPLSEQRAIVKILRATKNVKKALQKELELEQERKAFLMERLFARGTRGEGTQQTEIGEMPSSWDVRTPQDLLDTEIIGEIQDGNHGERHPKQSDFQRSGIPFLTADCIRGGKTDFRHAKYLDETWLDKLRVGFAKPGDVLLTHKGTVGETSIVNGRYDVVILSPQVTYYRIKDSKKLYPKYLFAVFQSPVFRSQLKRLASIQSTRAYVGITKQKKIRIPIPKFAEQVKIATALLACDKKSAALNGERALLVELFEALLEGFMTGRLLAEPLIETERNERKNRSAISVD
jgi:type I restriction enzyme S subunit